MKNPTTEAGICLPGETEWELWKSNGAAWQRTETRPAGDQGGPGAFRNAGIFVYPVTAAFAVPVWAQTTDEDLVLGIVDLQLEKLSLRPDNELGKLLDVKLVEREEAQTLAVAAVLNKNLADDLPKEAPAQFEISPHIYPMPDNHLVIWKELGRIVFCVTRRDNPVYFGGLTATSLNSASVSEMEHLLMPLYTQGIVAELEGAVLWTDDSGPDAAQALANAFGVRVRREPKPAPKPPAEASSIEPVSVALGKIRAARAAKIRNIAGLSVLAYLLVLGAFAAWFFYRKSQADQLAQEKNRLQYQFGWVTDAAMTAQLMENAVNFDKYPVEVLRACIEPLYDNNPGVRITGFNIEKGHITITGEAKDNSKYISYVNRIKQSKAPALQGFKWPPRDPQPKGDVVSFRIAGEPDTGEETPTGPGRS